MVNGKIIVPELLPEAIEFGIELLTVNRLIVRLTKVSHYPLKPPTFEARN
jgi:hypothetical protein